jgi:two-component system response regulator GlrR
LNVVSLELPPQAARREDTPLLDTHFLKHAPDRQRGDVNALAPEALELLMAAAWPGNAHQLKTLWEQMVALSSGRLIPATAVPWALHQQAHDVESVGTARRRFEFDYLIRLLKITDGRVTHAVRLAKRIARSSITLLQRYGPVNRLRQSAVQGRYNGRGIQTRSLTKQEYSRQIL